MTTHPDPRLVEVELVDEDPVDSGPAAPKRASRPAGWSAGGRRTLLRVAAGLVVVGVVVVANVVERAEVDRRARALATMSGLVGPIGGSLETLWEQPAGIGSVVAGDVLLADDPAEVPRTYRAVDTATGRELWQVPLGPGGVDFCAGALATEPTPTILCWAAGEADPETGAPPTVTVAGLDAGDGRRVFERETALPDAGYGIVGSDLVTAHLEGRIVTVRRVDPASGEERWATGVPLEVPGADGTSLASIEVSNGFVAVRGPTAAVLSAQDGRELGRWNAQVDPSSTDLDLSSVQIATSESGFAVWIEAPARSSLPVGTWYDRLGAPVAEIPGIPVEPTARDRTVPETLLVTEHLGPDLLGVDLPSGQVLWSLDLSGGRVLMRRDGAAVVCDSTRVAAVDLRTGRERWSTSIEGLRPDSGSVTDGRHVVVVTVRDGVRTLAAIGLDTGEVAWTQRAPRSTVLAMFAVPGVDSMTLREVAGRPVAFGQRSVLGLG